MLATLIRTTGSWQLAEDAVQDAAERALRTWARDGVPAQPRAWLTLTARRCAIDALRRETARAGKEAEASRSLSLLEDLRTDAAHDVVEPSWMMRDDMLRLLFTCCHPCLPVQAQAALALRTLCGLTTAEVASALLVPEPTMAKRLTRAKRKITVAAIPYRAPTGDELPTRLAGVAATIYLLFNEGYHATGGTSAMRRQLTAEAIRLATLVDELLPGRIEVLGLRALLHLQDARAPARVDAHGDLVLLRDQDRTAWDTGQIRLGLSLLGQCLRHVTDRPNQYTVQAAIAACHDLAPSWERTNWAAIVSWYDVLVAITHTPVVRLNRAIAIGELRGPVAALAELERISYLDGYLPAVAARAELLARAGRDAEALDAFATAMRLPGNDAAKHAVAKRFDELATVVAQGSSAQRPQSSLP
ncbi:sigma-70 family RNA polymerase sigma factor [Allobranchiibius sp. CTAmp26]|nr:sigma-70 family RNA polymerase sigma factor [Allobranchiibius sp. CTAmp26]